MIPGHHLEGNAVSRERLDFLAAASEDEGVAALEPQHALAFTGQANEKFVDFLLAHGVIVALLADEDALRIAPGHVDDGLRHQVVVHHHIGLLHQAQGAESQQVGVAGAGADEVDLHVEVDVRTAEGGREHLDQRLVRLDGGNLDLDQIATALRTNLANRLHRSFHPPASYLLPFVGGSTPRLEDSHVLEHPLQPLALLRRQRPDRRTRRSAFHAHQVEGLLDHHGE